MWGVPEMGRFLLSRNGSVTYLIDDDDDDDYDGGGDLFLHSFKSYTMTAWQCYGLHRE